LNQRLLEQREEIYRIFQERIIEKGDNFKNIRIAYREVDFVVKKGTKVEKLIQICYDNENVDTKNREIRVALAVNQKLKCQNILVVT